MSQQTKHPSHIVVGFDFSDLSRLALADALGLASLNERTVLHILGVLDGRSGLGPVEPDGKADYTDAEKVQAEIKQVVAHKITKYNPTGFEYFIHARIGDPADELLGLAEECNADLIVVGTHGRSGLERLLLGSVAERVVRNASCPVLVMRPKSTSESDTAAADEAFQPEPPCPHCVVRRLDSDGREWWCEEHSKAYVQPHRYSYRTDGKPEIGAKNWSVFNR